MPGFHCPAYTCGHHTLSSQASSLTPRLTVNCLLGTSTRMSYPHLKLLRPKLITPAPSLLQSEIPLGTQQSQLEIWSSFLILSPIPTANRVTAPPETVPDVLPPPPCPHICAQALICWLRGRLGLSLGYSPLPLHHYSPSHQRDCYKRKRSSKGCYDDLIWDRRDWVEKT